MSCELVKERATLFAADHYIIVVLLTTYKLSSVQLSVYGNALEECLSTLVNNTWHMVKWIHKLLIAGIA